MAVMLRLAETMWSLKVVKLMALILMRQVAILKLVV